MNNNYNSLIKKSENFLFSDKDYFKFIGAKETYLNQSSSYFGCYSNCSIHESMIKDKVRTESFRQAISKNSDLFKDKIVLDVGCGTGLLSFFAVQSGAKHVIAVDAADVADFTMEIVKKNEMEGRITVIKGKIEEVELPSQYEKVDIIISEWMGYFLLYESMLDSVLYARDKWLVDDGLIFPDRFILNTCFGYDNNFLKEKYNFWDNVYGIDMSSMKKWYISEPYIQLFDENKISTTICKVLDIDLYTIKLEDLNFSSEFKFKVIKDMKINCLVSWFDVFFSRKLKNEVKFSTGPFNFMTHWKQTVFYLPSEVMSTINDDIKGDICVSKSNFNFRELDIGLSLSLRRNELFEYVEISKSYYKLR